MKKYMIAAWLLLVVATSFAQVDYCPAIQKAIKGAADNYSSYNNYQFLTVGGQKAFLADFTFAGDEKGYVYNDPKKQTVYFFQKITADKTKYQEIYDNIDHCLVKEADYWTKVDGAEKTSVIFVCSKTGCEVSLVTGDAGITIIIERNKIKDIPVFNTAFCTTLKMIAEEVYTDFKNIMGAYKDSSILGKSYKSTQQLNQRGITPDITIHRSYIKANTIEYEYNEMVAGSEMEPATVVSYFDQCLTAADGWIKGKPSYGDGLLYTKGDIEVRLTASKNYSYKEADNTHIHIQKKIAL